MRINGALNASDNADAPTAADGTVTAVKNTPYTFAAADFGFSATAGGDALVHVTILSRPAKGELERNGVALHEGQRVTRAQLDAGSVTYTPVTNEFGSDHASFFFRVTGSTHPSDDGYLMTVDVRTVPVFPSATVSLSVVENTTAGNVGAAITATDEDLDTLAYSVAATGDADGDAHLTAFLEDFELDATSGQVTVSSDPSIDFEDRPSYKVLVQASDSSGGADGTATLTITVTDVEEPGTATISGTLAVGQALEARVSDLDGGVSVQSWQWSRSPRPDSGFDDINSATGSSYTTVDADKDFFLRASASYTDRRSPGKSASGTTGLPVGVTAATQVKNTGQGDTSVVNLGDQRLFQAFTTGGNPAGYALSSVDLWLGDAIESVAILAKNPGNSDPGSLLLELANPDSMTTDAVNTFTAPAWILLDPDTTYFIRVNSGVSTFKYARTFSADEDSGAASGWDIANSVVAQSVGSFRTLTGRSLRIDIEGFALLGAPGPPATFTAAAGSESVALSWSEPGATGRRPVTKYQVRHKETSGSFGVWADVADSDSDSDLSDELSVTVSSLTAGTEYEFEVRAVNDRGEGTAAGARAIPTGQLNRQPAFPAATASLSVEENTTASVDVGAAITATDEDLDALAYSVAATTDTDAATHLTAFNRDFELDAASGQVTVKGGASIDFEGHPSYKVLVQVSDGKDSSFGTDPAVDAETTLTITVTDVEEEGTVAVSGTLSVGEDLSVVVSDPDGSVSGESWQWSRSPRPDTGFTSVGTSSAMYTTVDADKDFFLRASASYSDRRGSGKSASGTTGLPVGVTASTLVKNTGQASTGSSRHSGTRVYQAFTTGDNPAGYVLSSVDLWLADDVIRVEIEQNPQDMEPVSVAELANPDSMTPNAANTFTAPAGTVLAPDTTYFLRVFGSEFGNFDYAHTTSADEDSGEASGWSIADEVVGYNLRAFTTAQGRSLRIDIEGFALLGAPGPPASLAAAAGGGSVALSWSEPGSTGRRPVTKYQVHHRETGDSFGVWADVADSDSDNDLSDELSVTVSGLTAGTRYVFEVRAVNARGDGTAARVPATPTAVSITAPVFSTTDYPGGAAARSVAENAMSGDVGLPVAATDADGDSLTYSVAATGDTDADAHLAAFNRDFELDASSGQVSVRAGASIDFEDRSSYKVIYRVTDGEDAAGVTESAATIDDMLTLTVSVTNVDEAGAVTLVGTPQVGEVLTASLSDPDGSVSGEVWQWSKASTMSGSFTDIAGAMSAAYTVLAADEGEFLQAAVTYVDGFGAGRTASATSGVVVVAPSVPVFGLGAGTVQVSSLGEATGGTADVSSPFVAQSFSTGVVESDSFVVRGVRVPLAVVAGASASVSVWTTVDVGGSSVPGASLGELAALGPLDGDLSTVEVFESSSGVALSGATTYWLVFSRSGDDGGSVQVPYLASSGDFTDSATRWRLLGRVVVDEGKDPGEHDWMELSGGEPLAMEIVGDPQRQVAEHATSGDVGAAVAATDADGDDLTYSVAATGDADAAAHLTAFNDDFELDASSGQVSVKAGASIDYEDRSEYRVMYRVTDGEDAAGVTESPAAIDAEVTLTMRVTNADEAGTVTIAGTPQVGEELIASVSDPDGSVRSEAWRWSSAATQSGSFTAITGADSESYTATPDDVGQFLQAAATYTDGFGAGRTASATSAAVAAAAATVPMFAAADYPGGAAARSVAENATSGDVGLPVAATDADGDSLTYSVAATGETEATDHLADFIRDFELDTSSGQVSVRATALIDYETRSSYKVIYRVTDGEDAAGTTERTPVIDDTVTLTVSVTNVDEPGAVVIEGTPQVGEVLTASLSDPDVVSGTPVWQWSKAATMSGTFNAISGAMSASYTVLAADEGEFLKAAATYSDGFGSGRSASATSVAVAAAAATAPVFAAVDYPGDAASRSVAENATSGDVGAAITATDADGDSLTYSVAATGETDATDHLADFNRDFELDTSSGQVSVRATASIDYETRAAYRVMYQVTDGEDAAGTTERTPVIDDTVTLTVSVTNVDEPGAVVIAGTAQVGEELTAGVSDPDGTVSSEMWQWSRAATQSGSFTMIDGAAGAAYVPVAADDGMFLQATVTYTDDTHGAAGQSASAVTGAAVAGSAPVFAAGAGLVAAPYVSTLGEPANSLASTFEFPLDRAGQQFTTGGTTSDSFDVRSMRILSDVPAGSSIVAEIWSDDGSGDTSYPGSMVAALSAPVSFDTDLATAEEFTAHGVSLAGGTKYWLVFTWTLTGVRVPYLSARGAFADSGSGWSLGRRAWHHNLSGWYDSAGGVRPFKLAVDFGADRSVDENTVSGAVGSAVTATDLDGDALAYSVAATDEPDGDMHLAAFNRDFAVDDATGEISARPAAVIDFEDRSSYTVLYRVSDGEDDAGAPDAAIDDEVTLTIAVNNVNEAGAVAIAGVPQECVALTASLADPDGAASSVSWQWSSADSPSGEFARISGANSATYTPVLDDFGKFLRATATYTDDTHGSTGQTASATTGAAVLLGADTQTVPAFGDAVDTVLLDSLSASSAGSTDIASDQLAQLFTTSGTASDEFVLSRVLLPMSVPAGSSVQASIWSNDESGFFAVPRARLAVLSGPDAFDQDLATLEEFTASGVVLAGATWYWLVVSWTPPGSNARFAISHTSGRYTDAATGWGLGGGATDQDTTPEGVNWEASSIMPWRMRIVEGVTRSVDENTTSGAVGAEIAATDIDKDPLTYSVAATGASDGADHLAAFNDDFDLDTATGQVSVKTGASIDFETRPRYTVLYRVTDSEDAAGAADTAVDDTVTLTIRVTNVDEAGSVTISGTAQVGEELTAELSDPDELEEASPTWQWSRGDAQSGPFTAITDAVSESYTPAAADAGKFLQATATYTDGFAAGITASAATATAVTSVPVFGLGAGTVEVSSLAETRDGHTTNPTPFVAQLFTTGGSVSDSFVVRGARVPMAGVSGASEATVSVWSSVGSGNSEAPGVLVGDLGVPVPLDDDLLTVEEFVSVSGVVLAGATNYWLVFSREGDSGVMQVPSLESGGDFADADTGWVLDERVVFDEGNDRNNPDWANLSGREPLAVEIVGDPQRQVDENSVSGALGMPITATDDDMDDLTYSVAVTTESDAVDSLDDFTRDFDLNTGTGQISVKSDASIDFEDRSEYRVLYRVTDGEDSSGSTEGTATIDDEVTLTIRVANVDEPGSVSIVGTAQVGEELTAGVSDPDGLVSGSVVWQWSGAATQSGPFTDITVAMSAAYMPVAADVGMFLRATATYSDGFGAGRSANATSVAVAAAAASNAVPVLDSATGQVSVKSGGLIDFEDRSSYKVAVGVSDNKDSSGGADPSVDATATLTVTVTDVEEAGTAAISGTLSVGEALSASVSDPDGGVSGESWQWSRSPRPDTGFTSVGTSSAMYTTVADDDAFFLRAGVDYSDRRGSGKSASVTTALPVGVTASTQVKNTGQTSTGTDNNGNSRLFQGFTTGDNPAGYVLSSVGLRLSGTDIGAVELYAKHSSNSNPGSRLVGLEDPDSKTANAVNTFTAPVGTVLEPNTTFFVAVSRRSGATLVPYAYTASDSEDSGAASGWSIASNVLSWTSPNYFVLGNQILRIDIRGFDLLGRPGPVATFTATPGEGSVALSWTAPASTGRRPVTKYQVRHKETAGSFGAWADVADSDSDLSDELSVTVSGLTGGTDYTFEVRAVNARGDGTEADATATPTAVSNTVPAFSAAAAARSVAENASSGDVGLAVTATDADGDSLTYSVAATGDTDADAHLADFNEDFELNTSSGQVSVKSGGSIDFESRAAYKVLLEVTDGEDSSGAMESVATVDDMLTLTVTVTNVDEAGSVTLVGTVRVGETVTASVSDPDVVSGSVVWQWSKASTMAGSFNAISGAMSAAYVPVAADEGEFLKATATYTDGFGSGRSASATSTAVAAAAEVHTAPVFSAATEARTVAENTTSGDVGLAVTATDADGDSLTYSVAATGDTDADAHLVAFNEDFELNASSGQVSVKSGGSIDFEDRSTYVVLYQVTDGEDSSGSMQSVATVDDMLTLTVTVTNVDEAGTVALVGTAQVGQTLTASVSDPDGSVSSVVWQWSKASTMAGSFTAVAGAMSASYVPVAADVGEFLRATATYVDGFGSGRSASATSTVVLAAAAEPTAPAGAVAIAGTAQLNQPLTAAVSRSVDVVPGTLLWSWSRSPRPDSGFTAITDANMAEYTPVAEDLGFFLRATATYTDGGGNQTAIAATALPVGITQRALAHNEFRSYLEWESAPPGGWLEMLFQTGDNPAGYLLLDVETVHHSSGGVDGVEIWQDSAGLLYTLLPQPPQRVDVILQPDTIYSLRLVGADAVGVNLGTLSSTGHAHGWRVGFIEGSPFIDDEHRLDPQYSIVDFLPRMAIVDFAGIELLGPPGPPTRVSAGAGAGAVTLSWSEPGSMGQNAIVKYQVRHKRSSQPDTAYSGWVDVADTHGDGDLSNERSVTVTGLTDGTAHTLQVRAVNGQGNGTAAAVQATPGP